MNNQPAGALLAFAFITHEDPRGRAYVCAHMVRADGRGRFYSSFNYFDSLALARRLAERLADRHGITDRAGLHVGRIFGRADFAHN